MSNILQEQEPHADELPAGTVLQQRYIIEKVVGRGGFSITYCALDLKKDVKVAVKEYVSERTLKIERGEKEAEMGALLHDIDGVAGVQEYFVKNEIPFIIMEYIQGISVKQYIAQYGRMEGQEVLKKMKPLLETVSKIHDRGIIHRDISADNLMITQEGKLILIDFGEASILGQEAESSHTLLFKRGFAPVEQYRSNEKLGPWSDVYSLCATMYYMITGMIPEDAMERWIADQLKPLDKMYGTGLSMLQSLAIMKGMALECSDRYQNLKDLCRNLYGDRQMQDQELILQTEHFKEYKTWTGHTKTLIKKVEATLKKSHPKKYLWIAGIVIIILILFFVCILK